MHRKTNPDLPILVPDVAALLASARVMPSLPKATRVRALARARAFVTVTKVSRRGLATDVRHRWLRHSLTVSVVLVGIAVGVAVGAVLAQ